MTDVNPSEEAKSAASDSGSEDGGGSEVPQHDLQREPATRNRVAVRNRTQRTRAARYQTYQRRYASPYLPRSYSRREYRAYGRRAPPSEPNGGINVIPIVLGGPMGSNNDTNPQALPLLEQLGLGGVQFPGYGAGQQYPAQRAYQPFRPYRGYYQRRMNYY